MISVIVPVLNEAKDIVEFLQPLQKYRNKCIEIIVVDGGSTDTTVDLARPLCDVIEMAEKGRANQMNSGVDKASGDIFLFLHADTVLPEYFPEILAKSLVDQARLWGRFDIRLSGRHFSLRMIEFFMNYRSRWTGIATGDQAIFVRSRVFHQLQGYQNIPLMEDIALSKDLKKIASPVCLKEKVTSSSRRWEKYGIWRTIFLMWLLRLAYFFGIDPHYLAAKYK